MLALSVFTRLTMGTLLPFIPDAHSLSSSPAQPCNLLLTNLGCLLTCLCQTWLLIGHNWAQNSTSPGPLPVTSPWLKVCEDGEDLVFGRCSKDVKGSQRSAGSGKG
jgi:hypothetical protein